MAVMKRGRTKRVSLMGGGLIKGPLIKRGGHRGPLPPPPTTRSIRSKRGVASAGGVGGAPREALSHWSARFPSHASL